MARKQQYQSIPEKLLQKMATGWGILISGLTIMGMGFGTGCYLSDNLHKLEMYKKEVDFNNKLWDLKNDYTDKIKEYTRIIDNLQNRNSVLEKENEEFKNNTRIKK